MSSADVLDDYLGELLLQALPASAAPAPADTAVPAPAQSPPPPPAAESTDTGEEASQHPPAHPAADTQAQTCANDAAEPIEPAAMPVAEMEAVTPSIAAAPAPTTAAVQPTMDRQPTPAIPPTAAPAPLRAPPPVSPPMPAPTARTSPAPASGNSAWQQLQLHARERQVDQNNRHGRSEPVSRWLRLRCGQQTYALELLKVQEVVLPVPLLALRGTGHSMQGIMNLRGQVVPVIDLGLHLGAAAIEDDALTRIVVLEENGDTLGLRVSAVEDVASLAESQIEPPDTARICQISNDLFRGVARLSHQPMILLDASRLLR